MQFSGNAFISSNAFQYIVFSDSTLSLLSSSGQGRETIMKASWVRIRAERDHSPDTVTGKTGLTLGKINLVYYQSDQSRTMRNKYKS